MTTKEFKRLQKFVQLNVSEYYGRIDFFNGESIIVSESQGTKLNELTSKIEKSYKKVQKVHLWISIWEKIGRTQKTVYF